jgi:hypothetical protein
MAVAMIYPEAKRGGDRKSSSKIEIDPGAKLVHQGLLSYARTVLQTIPNVAAAVLAGEISLTNAFNHRPAPPRSTHHTPPIKRLSG